MKYVWAYHKTTGEKRRIPETWMRPNVFGDSWSLTPSSRDKKSRKNPVETTTDAPANGDTPRKDQ